MRRWFAILLALGAWCAGAEENGVIRVVTYNIHHGEGSDGVVNLDRIAGILNALEPDIVCLQEVDRHLSRTDRRDFPAEFAQLLDMKAVFESNFDFDNGEYGNATFTKLPIQSWKRHALPGPEDAEPRGLLEVLVDTGGATLRVLNTHLGLNGSERLQQTRAIAALLDDTPTVLLGDFNEPPGGSAMEILETELAHCADELAEEGHLTFSAQRPSVRIDHILHSDDISCTGHEVIHTDATAVASDHLPVLCEIRHKDR